MKGISRFSLVCKVSKFEIVEVMDSAFVKEIPPLDVRWSIIQAVALSKLVSEKILQLLLKYYMLGKYD